MSGNRCLIGRIEDLEAEVAALKKNEMTLVMQAQLVANGFELNFGPLLIAFLDREIKNGRGNTSVAEFKSRLAEVAALKKPA
jgi:hypothetical protein